VKRHATERAGHRLAARRAGAAGLALLLSLPAALQTDAQIPPLDVETLTPVAALPAHIAGSFQALTACQQTAGGDYFVFDRRAHAVYVVPRGADDAQKVIEIGAEPGRLLDPTAFRLGEDGTFVVADAPGGIPRIQIFTPSGSTLNGFYLTIRSVPRITFNNMVLSGVSSVEYTRRRLLFSLPELGGLITEYATDGRPIRTFGDLRPTGQEGDRDVHLALNSGIVISHPAGGYYFVFLAGVPQFRRYDASGEMLFERHIEGRELDRFVQNLPTTWKRHRTDAGVVPLVLPTVYTAAADPAGNLWVSLAVGVTYVYDAAGDKRRIVGFQAARPLLPTGLWFTPGGRVLVTPGCYAFAAR
jgi:hypothetical protein